MTDEPRTILDTMHRLVWLTLKSAPWGVCFLVVLFGCSHQESTENDIPAQATADVSDERFREMVLGIWTDDYKGRRTLTVRADGTATMVVELKGLSAKLFAETMTFQEEWSINDGHFKMTAVGGEPKARVQLILKAMGNVSDQKILELTKERMLLLDSDGETMFDWRKATQAD